jgi:hypothetical protein
VCALKSLRALACVSNNDAASVHLPMPVLNVINSRPWRSLASTCLKNTLTTSTAATSVLALASAAPTSSPLSATSVRIPDTTPSPLRLAPAMQCRVTTKGSRCRRPELCTLRDGRSFAMVAVLWAVLFGNVDLARLLWPYSSSPLRTALIARRLCLILRTKVPPPKRMEPPSPPPLTPPPRASCGR